MADHSKVLGIIANSTDAGQIRCIRDNATRLGVPSVEDAAFRRLVEMLAQHAPDSIEHDFWKTIHAFEEILSDERSKTVRLARTRQKVVRVGVKQTLIDFAMKKTPTTGFKKLIELGHGDLTGEALILKHGHTFAADVREAARRRLGNAGVDVAGLQLQKSRK